MFRGLFLCLMTMVILSGCALIAGPDPLDAVRERLGVEVVEEGRVKTTHGTVIFYRYGIEGQCGFGAVVLFKGAGSHGGNGSNAAGDCHQQAAINSIGNFHSGYHHQEGPYIFMTYGGIFDPKVAKVTATLADGNQVDAKVGEQMYYLALDGDGPPDIHAVQLEAFDAQGVSLGKYTFER